MFSKFILICFLCSAFSAVAQESFDLRSSLGGFSQQDGIATQIGLDQRNYIDNEPYFRDGAVSNNTSFLLRSSSDDHYLQKKIGGKWDIESEYSASENWNYFRPREAYVRDGEFAFGRKKVQYSNWEDEWGQSLFEPRFMDDKLRNSKAGLTGLFFEHEGKFAGFGSLISPSTFRKWGRTCGSAIRAWNQKIPGFNRRKIIFTSMGRKPILFTLSTSRTMRRGFPLRRNGASRMEAQ